MTSMRPLIYSMGVSLDGTRVVDLRDRRI